MTPIVQTVTESGRGNCLAACLASILEVPIGDVPDLKCGADFVAMRSFLAAHGAVPIWIYPKDIDKSYVGYTPEYCVAIGASPRIAGARHAVVARPNGYGYMIVHDPHPEGGGLAGPIESVIYLGATVANPEPPR